MPHPNQRPTHGNPPRGPQNRTPGREASVSRVSANDLREILDGSNPQKLVKTAEDIARNDLIGGYGKKGVSTSQIRNIYGTVKMLEGKGLSEEVLSKLVFLKPKLAYAAGRHSDTPGMKCLQHVLSEAIDLVYEKKERFQNFCKFFEAILAYHKAEGGK